MQPGSTFIERLHEDQLDDAWADGTDWSLVGSHEDGTVSYDSAIDKGDPADQKFGYLDNGGKVTHTGVRTLFGSNDYHLRYASALRHAHDQQRLVAAEDGLPGGDQGRRRAAERTAASQAHHTEGPGAELRAGARGAPGHPQVQGHRGGARGGLREGQ